MSKFRAFLGVFKGQVKFMAFLRPEVKFRAFLGHGITGITGRPGETCLGLRRAVPSPAGSTFHKIVFLTINWT